MNINPNPFHHPLPDSAYDTRLSALEISSEESQADNASTFRPSSGNGSDAGFAPISPETPSFGPPSSNGGDAGFAPISPETPSFGPPSGNGGDAGFAPISPETPSFGPPSGSGGDAGFAPISPETPSFGPPSGSSGSSSGSTIPSVIIVPGQPIFPSTSTNRTANVRFLHAAPNQPAVSIRLGNRTLINGLQFGTSTPYYLDTANQRLLVTVTNARTGAVLYRGYFTFASQTAYTISIAENNSGLSLYMLTDTPCNRTNYGCLRAVNLSPNSGAVDIFMSGYGRIFQSVNPFSYTGYRLISQGAYRASVSEALPCTNDNLITITADYVECSNTRIAIMDTSSLTVMNGVTYTLYIIGLAYQSPALRILPLESDLIY